MNKSNAEGTLFMKFKRLYIRFNQSELDTAIIRYHFEDKKTVFLDVYKKLIRKVNPVLYYEYDFPQKNHMTTVISLGIWPDDAIASYQAQEQFSEAYAIECISLELLSQTYKQLKEILYRERHCFLEKMLFCEEDELHELIPRLKNRWGSFPVSISDSNALLPSKTVVFYGKLGMQGQVCQHICRECQNTDCCFRNISGE